MPTMNYRLRPFLMLARRSFVGYLALLFVCQHAYARDDLPRMDVLKSPSDTREYESFVLDNKLKVLIISDSTADKGAASLDVNVGSGSDPEGRGGLAHFLEHMLFLGTKKYPEPGEYKAFINAHAGTDNAYTAFNNTNYYFDIDKNHLEPALDRFAQFFTSPLFTEAYVNRERTVVHSEFSSRRKDDGRRAMSARRQAFNPRHPLVTFSVGNLDTLADREGNTIRDELLTFYENHYSSNIMSLVVLGKEPLDTLRTWVKAKFSDIENRNLEPLRTDEPLFEASRLPARIDILPIKVERGLSMTFPIPPIRDYWRAKPTMHISHLLGHEGQGSLLSLLKNKGWADGLSAGAGINHDNVATFNVSVALTQAGVEHIDDLVAFVFQAIKLVREQGVKKWIFEENRKLADIGFAFEEKTSAISYVRGLASALHHLPARDILRAHYALETYHPGKIREILGHLRPDNLFLTVTAPGLETDQKSPYYDADYSIRAIDEVTVARWSDVDIDPALSLPTPNEFIPDELSVREANDASSIPVNIKTEKGFELWHQQDTTFKLPRADFYFSLRSPRANDTAEHAALTELYIALVNDQLNEFSYPASLAGLSYSLYKHLRGFSARISGYTGKQARLLKRMINALKNPKLDPQRFAIIKANMLRNIRNSVQDAPYNRAIAEVRTLLVQQDWSDEELLAALQEVDINTLANFYPTLLDGAEMVVLSHGSLTPEEAIALAEPLHTDLLAHPSDEPVASARVVKLADGAHFLRTIESSHNDSAVALYLQGDKKDIATRAKIALISHMISPPFFEDIRTEKQLGYVVFAYAMSILETPGMSFVVQSPQASSGELRGHIENFLERYTDTLASLSDDDFARHKSGLLTEILKESTQLQQRTNRYWTELDRRHYNFDQIEKLAQAVRNVTLDELRQFYAELLLSDGRKRLSVYAIGQREQKEMQGKVDASGTEPVGDARTFKNGQRYFPDYAS